MIFYCLVLKENYWIRDFTYALCMEIEGRIRRKFDKIPIPGNDDAIRSIKLFANLIAESYVEGIKLYEDKMRAMSDKKSDVVKEKVEAAAPQSPKAPRGKPAPAKASGGPAVVKATSSAVLSAVRLAVVKAIIWSVVSPCAICAVVRAAT